MSDAIIAQLKAVLSIDTRRFDSGIRGADRSLKDVAASAGGTGRAFAGMEGGFRTAAGGANVLRGALAAVAKATVVLGLIDVGRQAIQTAVKFDSYSKALESTLGSSKRVKQEMRDLKEIAKLPGIGLEESIQSFQRFVAVGVSAAKSKKLIEGLGKLNAKSGGSAENFNESARQFSQILSAGKITEENLGVIKERMPAFAKILKDTFGTATAEGLKKAGVSTDQFVAKISDAMQRTKGVTNTAQNSFDNFSSAATDALNSIGTLALPAVTKGLDFVSNSIQGLSDSLSAFSESSIGQKIGANLSSAFSSIESAATKVGAAFKSAFADAGIAINSGDIKQGIQTFTAGIAQVAKAVESFVSSSSFKAGVSSFIQGLQAAGKAVAPIAAFIQAQFAVVVQWFQANMPLISRTVQTVLTFVTQFWRDHGAQIMSVVGPLWAQIKLVISTALTTVLGVIKLAMQVITGDWRGAGDTIKGIVSGLASFVIASFRNLGSAAIASLKLLASYLQDMAGRYASAAAGIGRAIIDGIGGAIRGGAGRVIGAVTNLGSSALSALKKRLGIHSPSKEFALLGVYSAEGYADGLSSKNREIVAATKKMGENALSWLRSLPKMSPFGNISDSAVKRLKAENDEAQRLLDTLKQLTRARLVAKFGENSLPVLRNDFPNTSKATLKGVQSMASSNAALEAGKQQAESLHQAYAEARKQHLLATAATLEDKVAIEQFGKAYVALTSAANKSMVARIAAEQRATEAIETSKTKTLEAMKAYLQSIPQGIAEWYSASLKAQTAQTKAAEKQRKLDDAARKKADTEAKRAAAEAERNSNRLAKTIQKNLQAVRRPIESALADAFRGAVLRGENIFKSLSDSIKQMLIDLAAQWAASEVVKALFGLMGKKFTGLSTDSAQAQKHMLVGAAAIAGASVALKAASKSVENAGQSLLMASFASSQATAGMGLGGLGAGAGIAGIGGGIAGGIASKYLGSQIGGSLGVLGGPVGMIGGALLGGLAGKALGSIFGGVKKIFGFANGGRPPLDQPSIIGERGAEIFWPDKPGRITSHTESKSILAGGSGGVNFNGTVIINDAADVKRIQAITRSKRQSRFRLA
jgi:tape measure domain-containing protein